MLAWLGRGSKKAFKKWDDMKPQLKADLIQAMIGASAAPAEAQARKEALKVTAGMDYEALYSDAPFPVRVLFKWLQVVPQCVAAAHGLMRGGSAWRQCMGASRSGSACAPFERLRSCEHL